MPDNEYDYVIVGAGSAGCVLANRLTAGGRRRVLLLEAGGSDRRFWIQVPIGYGKSFYNPAVNWMYRTEPDPALDGRQGYWPRGKVLGGSSSINAMVHVRGHPGDFDDWRDAGNPGWGWDDVLPYFKRSEDFAGGADEWRGAGGPLHVSTIARERHPVCLAYLRACAEAGIPSNPDFNGERFEGAGLYQIATRNGLRMSAARAYLWPARRRPNLRIETAAHATRILFSGTRAVGVEYLQGGAIRRALAGREVILAAGAVNSPQLLQLSGVGPADLLARRGIPVVADRPAVGANLQDHLCIDHLYRARGPTLNDMLRPWWGKLRVGLAYLLFRRGPLAISVNQGGGFVKSRPDLARPDLQLYFSPLSYTRGVPGKRALMRPDPFPGFLLSAQPCRPTSRGHIAIRSADPFAPPAIHPNSLATEYDRETLLAGSRLLRRLAAAPALAAIVAEELAPGPAATGDAALAADIRARASSVFHPVSTCRMGPDDGTSVVDHRLRAHRLGGLRIVDASVFPALTSGNTNAPTIMVAEKGADLVLADA
ncbi:GMC family oxidoreductase [Stella sp.]|uniref:GMC family oxidoreductase n=1 Tax=Stella sp. TaxID=2912054 RepID=UPI0035B4E927